MNFTIDERRILAINNHIYKQGSIVYLMSRDQRVSDNWALLYAQKIAIEQNVELIVVFNLFEKFLEAQDFQFEFMLSGLLESAEALAKLNIPLTITSGRNLDEFVQYISTNNVGMIICDFDPLKIKQNIQKELIKKVQLPIIEVDAHNIVPCRFVSQKVEFGAYTIRPKIKKLLNDFLVEIPELIYHTQNSNNNFLQLSENVKELLAKFKRKNTKLESGESNAKKRLNAFLNNELNDYNELRNFPELNKQSNLSPYIHFGQISAQRIALEVAKSNSNLESKESFLEELIVRRELSDNFCFYNSNYDNFDGFPDWAKKSLNEHRDDKREHIYSLDIFENGQTKDKYWNSAQSELLQTGKMHGYMRMYWAKKILEWSISPESAIETAIYLNDKYQLDGRDPNGYAGIAWSIGGVHDRAWAERQIFGKIRYMNDSGLKRKFDIEKYVKLYQYKNHLFA